MRSKIFKIIAIVVILPAIYYTGLSTGKKQARQECIETVNENCEYICGVGLDFYFPDKEDRKFNNREYLEQDSMVARYQTGNSNKKIR